jgi:hypothetical protein
MNHVSDMDPDSHWQSAPGWISMKGPLDFNGAFCRFKGAAELYQESVSHCLDLSAVVSTEDGPENPAVCA